MPWFYYLSSLPFVTWGCGPEVVSKTCPGPSWSRHKTFCWCIALWLNDQDSTEINHKHPLCSSSAMTFSPWQYLDTCSSSCKIQWLFMCAIDYLYWEAGVNWTPELSCENWDGQGYTWMRYWVWPYATANKAFTELIQEKTYLVHTGLLDPAIVHTILQLRLTMGDLQHVPDTYILWGSLAAYSHTSYLTEFFHSCTFGNTIRYLTHSIVRQIQNIKYTTIWLEQGPLPGFPWNQLQHPLMFQTL